MENTPITEFQDFTKSVNLSLEFASPNEEEWYLNLFSYDGEKWKRENLMYLYGENQFDTAWEYQYHDCLTIGRKVIDTTDKILVLGSWDFMNHRFIGTYDLDLIDIDPFMTDLAASHPLMLQMNQYVPSANYRVHNMDAVVFVEENEKKLSEYRYIIIDFPVMISPVSDQIKKFWLEKFFSREMFVDIILKNLPTNGLITMQADDTFVHTEHEQYFRNLIEGTGVFFHIYTIDFKETELKQYFYMFTKDPVIYHYFQEHIHSIDAALWLFRKDDYFTNLFELLETKQLDYQTYTDILAGK